MSPSPYRVTPVSNDLGTGLPVRERPPRGRHPGMSDGAPTRPAPRLPDDDQTGTSGAVYRAASRVRTFEGPRGVSTRATVMFRHVGYLGTIALCVGTAHWAFSENATWHFGGLLMLYSIAFMLAIAAIGSVLYAEARTAIYDQVRHFVFGIVALPGAALSLFMRVVSHALGGPSADGDMFATIIRGNGLPLVYFSLIALPAFVFAKYIFGGLRSANRSATNDEENVAAIMRQDGWQR